MKIAGTAAAVILAVGLASGAAGAVSGPVVVDRVVAVVNDEIITMSDLQRELAKGSEARDERLMLEEMIDRKLQMAAAKRSGMDVSDREVSDAIADIMKRNHMDTARFEAELAKEGMTLEQYRVELREQMTLSRLFNKQIRAGVAVDEADIRDYYEKNASEFSLPEEIRVRHLVIKVAEKATADQEAAARARANSLMERIKAGGDFSRIIRESSEGPTAAQEGDLGFMQRGHAVPEIEAASRNLKPGEYAGPLRCADGFHIIRVEDIRTPKRPFEKVKDEIARKLYEQKVEVTYRTWLQTLRSDSHIENRL